MTSTVYHWCVVPKCTNTTTTTPDKVFIQVPKNPNRRKKWFSAIRREPAQVSSSSVIFVCEDHFDLPNDMENYMRWKLTGCYKIMRKDCVPHKFSCQLDRAKRTCPQAPRSVSVKRQKLAVLHDILNESEKETAENGDVETNEIESTMKNCEDNHFELSVKDTVPAKTRDCGVNVKIKPHFRSRGTQCELSHVTHASTSMKDIVLKIRVSGCSDPDFIEIDIPKWKLTYKCLLKICCEELQCSEDQVERIRKLPNTRLRNDNDVHRLEHYQALELVMKGPPGTDRPTNCYQSISTCKDQTILY